MHKRSNVIYLYDGSFEGLLCCIFESYEKKELPSDIAVENEASQISLYDCRFIPTDTSKARRVKDGIIKKASKEVFTQVKLGFYTCHPKKELLILGFVRLALKHGKKVLSMLADKYVDELGKAVLALTRESHQLKGFVRFSVYGGTMAAVIEPKNFVLPLLAEHFCDRYHNETFMIFDKTHKAALVYTPRRFKIIPVENYIPPTAEAEELEFRSLWRLFFKTIAIKERFNPKCQMSHMQKRYWKHLTEQNEPEEFESSSANNGFLLPDAHEQLPSSLPILKDK